MAAAAAGISLPLTCEEAARQRPATVLMRIAGNAVPAMLTNLLGFVTETINALFIGHYGSTEALAAVGVGNMLQNCCGLSIGIGLSSALDTLVSQAHGAGEDRLACAYLQRARIITALQMLWILPILCFSDKWLVAIGQDPSVARLAAEYNTMAAPFMLFWFQASCSRRFLACMLRPKAAMIVGAICAVLHVLWCTIFVAHLGLGNRGLGIANGISWTVRHILLTGYLWWLAPTLNLSRWSVVGLQRQAFAGWREFMRTALPALVQTCSEWWFFEFMTLFVGYMGKDALAAHVTTQNIMTLAFMVPLSFSGAVASLTGNAIGAANHALAKQTAWLSLWCTLCVWLLIAVGATTFRSSVAAAFTKEPDVQRLAQTLLLMSFWASGFFDVGQNVLGGVCRGIGRLKAASSIYLLSFYSVSMPIGLLLGFPLRCGVLGIYASMALGTCTATAAFSVVLSRISWPALAAEVRERLARDAQEVSPVVRELATAKVPEGSSA